MARQALMSFIFLTFLGDVMFLLQRWQGKERAARVNQFSSCAGSPARVRSNQPG
jgi:hypothetical protein